MTLQSTQRFVDHPEAAERLSRTVDDLDETIKIIRSTIFGLRAHGGGPEKAGLRRRVSEAVQVSAGTLGFTPALRIEGLVDTDVPGDVADHALAVLGEALSNAARHSGANSVDVHLRFAGGELTLTVADDGCGVPQGVAQRAAEPGGTGRRAGRHSHRGRPSRRRHTPDVAGAGALSRGPIVRRRNAAPHGERPVAPDAAAQWVEWSPGTGPSSCEARTAAWTRRCTPSLASSREMWFLTVFSDR